MSYYAELRIRVLARTSRSEIIGYEGDVLKVKLRSAPVDGAANDELINLLADKLQKPKSYFKIKSGHTSKLKTICILVNDSRELKDELG